MPDSPDRTGRRAFLGTAGVTLTGLAGCMSTNGDSTQQTTTNQSTERTTTTEVSTTRITTEQSTNETTTNGNSEKRTTQSSSNPKTLLYPSNKTTAFSIDLQDNPIMGSPDAPVDLYYWSDYQCPFCNRFEQETFPKLLDDFIKQGKLRLIFLEYVTIGAASKTAARMSKSVWRQVRDSNPNAFKRWHASIFDAQKKPNSGWASKQNLLDITASVKGVDSSKVASDLQENKRSLAASVAEDKKSGQNKGVNVTPSFIFYNPNSGDTVSIQGAQPLPRFEATIEEVTK